MINTISGGNSIQIATSQQISNVASISLPKEESIARDAFSANASLSTLSRQLAESAVRAEVRDKSMDRRQLGAETSRILREMSESNWRSDEAGYVTELPDTTDPELLDRARQATEYVARHVNRNLGVKNPFAELSREQLNLIVYDEKGPYTLHERSAAYSAVCAIESKWNHALWGPERAESAANNGRTPNFFIEILAHYRSLDPIEQAQYPDNYETRLEGRIMEDSDPASVRKMDDMRPLSLFETIALYGFPEVAQGLGILDEAVPVEPETTLEGGWQPAVKTSSLSPDVSPTPEVAGRS